MRQMLSTLTLNQRLAAFTLALGAIAVFAQPVPGGAVSIDARDLAAIVQRDADTIEPRELADRIVQGRIDFRLIDARGERAFATYRIPGAENVPIGALADADLPRNEQYIVYADDGVKAAQAWFLMKARGYRAAYFLRGGLDGWMQTVLFPALPENPTPEQARQNARLTAIAARFGGKPRSGAAGATPMIGALPPPAPIAGAVSGGPTKKRKKEGC